MVNYTAFVASHTSRQSYSQSIAFHSDVSDDDLLLENEDLEEDNLRKPYDYFFEEAGDEK